MSPFSQATTKCVLEDRGGVGGWGGKGLCINNRPSQSFLWS